MVIPLYGKNMSSFMASAGKRKVLLLGRIVDSGFICVLLLKQQEKKQKRSKKEENSAQMNEEKMFKRQKGRPDS